MRRRAREVALQILYQLDVGGHLAGGGDSEMSIQHYWDSFDPVTLEEKAFAERIVRGVLGDVAAIDAAIDGASTHWKLDRMAKVDRSLLRLATYEILWCPDIPASASINEAIEIGKRFSGTDSAGFLNGILDNVAKASAP